MRARVLGGGLAFVLAISAASRAEEKDKGVAAARALQESRQDAVVWVSAVMKMQMAGLGALFGHGQEQKSEALGTVIDQSGLTVVSYTMLDPMSLMASFSFMQDGQEAKFESKTQFSDVKMRLADGTEIPARLVLKDPDLDLAFIAPEKTQDAPPRTFSHVDLKDSASAEALDVVIALGRLGKSLNRESTVDLGRLNAVVRKPRTFYVGAVGQGLGVPVFTLDRKVLGIALMRKGPQAGGLGLGSLMGGGISPVVLPAEDVREIAEQARRKADEKPQD